MTRLRRSRADVRSPTSGVNWNLTSYPNSFACVMRLRLGCSKSWSNRDLLASKYSGTRSIAIQFLPNFSATTPVVLDPAKGSTTKSPSSVSIFTKNSGKAAGNLAGCILRPRSLQRFVYASFEALFPNFSMFSETRSPSRIPSITFGGIEPPALILSKVERIMWPDGRTAPFTPFLFRRIMSGLYSFRTDKLLAFGQGVFESHQTYSTESRTRTRLTVTHSAGAGIFAGLYQKHSWARWKPTCSTRAIRSLKW